MRADGELEAWWKGAGSGQWDLEPLLLRLLAQVSVGCVARVQRIWCSSAAVGTQMVALAKWPGAALVAVATCSLVALVPFGLSGTELFKSIFDLSVV